MRHPTRQTGSIRPLVAAALLALLAGCSGTNVEPVPDIPETVEYDTVKMEYGDDDGVAPEEDRPMGTQKQMMVGARSQIALFGKATVFRTNVFMYYVFWLMDQVTQHRPTFREGDKYIWVGFPSGKYVRFEAWPTGENSYGYHMQYGNSRTDSAELFSGTFTRLAPDSDIQQGFGRLNFELDTAKKYGDGKSEGTLTVAFRRRGGVRQVRAQYTDFIGENDEKPLDARNRYTQIDGDKTRFAFFGRKNFHDAEDGEEEKEEFFSIDAAWLADRRGRTAAKVEEGNLDQPIEVDQCWDGSETVVWEDSTPDLPGEGGAKSDCAEPLRDLEMSAPTYEEPNGPPAVPAPHPEE